MRIKIIHHNQMKRSVNYLFDKLTNPQTKLFERLAPHTTAQSFIDNVNELKEIQQNKTGKKLDINNSIKHLVVSFHPEDREQLPHKIDSILEDVFKMLNLNPENHGVTVFEHNDRPHSHYHLIFSRVGVEGELFNDQKLGWRINDLANRLDEKYSLTKEKKRSVKIHFKHLYKPTTRGELLKLINFATFESKSLTEFQKILQEYGVHTRKGEDMKLTYITKDRKVFPEDRLPKEARMRNLYNLIKTQKHTKEFLEFRNEIQTKIQFCESLNDLKIMFPEAKINYQRDGDVLRNVSIHYMGMTIRLDETIVGETHVRHDEHADSFILPIIFIPFSKDNSYEEEKEKILSEKHKRRGKQLGFKIQY